LGKVIKKLRNLFVDAELVIFVTPSGEMSNFLPEDYDAVLSFMNAEKHKKKLGL